jgi:hypothetical protein
MSSDESLRYASSPSDSGSDSTMTGKLGPLESFDRFAREWSLEQYSLMASYAVSIITLSQLLLASWVENFAEIL